MEIVSLSPIPAGSLLWQPRPGSWIFTFASKATFLLAPLKSQLAQEQEPIHHADRHWSDDPAWSVYAPADVVPMRPRADVVLVGHAFAPQGKPVRSLLARLLVGEVDKSIEVHGDRFFTQEGALQEGPGFTRMALLWELAAGGPDTSNPVGVRSDARDRYGRRKLPNLQQPGARVASPDDPIEPTSFGPIAAGWPSRRQKLGAHAATFSDLSVARDPLPPDLDAAYFNAAPRDQQAEELRDDERLILEHLHPKHARLVTNLSGHRPRAFLIQPGKTPHALPMRPDLLWIHTDRGLCTLTWRGQIQLPHPGVAGRVVIALEEPGQTLDWKDVEPRAAALFSDLEAERITDEGVQTLSSALEPDILEETHTLSNTASTGSADLKPAGAVLPFAPSPAAARPPAAASPAAARPRPRRPLASGTVDTPVDSAAPLRPSDAPPARGGLPFRPSAPPPPPPVPAPPPIPPPPPVPAPPLIAPPAPVMAPPPIAPPAPVMAPPPIAPPAPVMAPPPSRAPMPSTPAPIAPSPQPRAQAPSTPPPARDAVLHASNAAAAKPAPEPKQEAKRAQQAAAGAAAQGQTAPTATFEVLDLLWFERASLPRIRKKAEWRAILQALEDRPPDPELDDVTLGSSPAEVEDRRDVFEILVKGSAADAAGVDESLAKAIRADGKIVPPLVLAAGELVLPFDEVEALKAHVALIAPLSAGDEKLRAELALVKDYLAAPDLACAPQLVDTLSIRLWEAFNRGKRAVPAEVLRAHADAVLLQKRKLQRREVFGGGHVRALLQGVPAYLPAALAGALPVFQQFRARVLAEVHLPVDQHEIAGTALRVIALARGWERARPAHAPAAASAAQAPSPPDART